MANPITSSLPAYVDENRIALIAKSVLGARTAKLVNLNTGIVDAAAINLLDSDIKFGDGSICGWNPAGTQTMTQRKIQTGQIAVNVPYCDKALLKSYANHQIKVAAGAKTMPFEEELVAAALADIQAKAEKAIWMGDTDDEDVNLNKFDGFAKLIDAEVTAKDVTLEPGTTVYGALKAVNQALPAEIRSASDVAIFVGEDTFASFIQEMVDANLYHVTADNDGHSYKLPGFNVVVEAVPGLNGSKKIYGGRKSNFFIGCDMANDSEVFTFEYAKEAKEFRLDVEFNLGTQVAFPDQIVKATLS